MRLLLAILVGGCFSPSEPAGAPCDTRDPHCPHAQACYAGTCATTPPPIDAPADVAIDAMVDARPDAPPDAPPVTATYPAKVALCFDQMAPAAGACETAKGTHTLAVDGMDGTNVWVGYVRFDVGNELAGLPITDAQLRLTTLDNADAASDQSGAIYAVGAFDETSLATTVPTKGQKLDASFGPIAQNTTILIHLPLAAVKVGKPLYLGIYSQSSDGVEYWDENGTTPPTLALISE